MTWVWYCKLVQLIQRKHCCKIFVRSSLRIEIVDVINYLEKKILLTDTKDAQHITAIAKKGYFVLDGILYYESNEVSGRRRLVVPEQLRNKVVSV